MDLDPIELLPPWSPSLDYKVNSRPSFYKDTNGTSGHSACKRRFPPVATKGRFLPTVILLYLLCLIQPISAIEVGDRVRSGSEHNMRSSTSTASSSNIVGTAWEGIEGEVVDGPAAGTDNSFTWWKVAWDSNPTAWSAEGNNRLIVINRPGTFSVTSPTVGQSFTLPNKPSQLDWGNSSDATEYEVRLERGDSTPDTLVDTVGSSNWSIDETLTAGTWYWQVRAINSAGERDMSQTGRFVIVAPPEPDIADVSPDPVPPSTSVDITITGNDFTSSTTLEFRDPDGTTFASVASKLSFVSSTRIDYDMNNDNDVGSWQVRAITPGASPSDWFSFTVGVAPQDPEITDVSPDPVPPSTSVAITITGSDFTGGTTLEFRDPDGTTFASVASKLSFVSSTRIDYDMNNDNDAGGWQVRAITPGASPSDWFSFTVGVSPIPEAPTILSPGTSSAPGENISGTSPTFSWDPVPGAVRYSIAISKAPYGPGNTVYTSDYRYGESFPIPAGYLQTGTLYRWQLGAINSAGQEGPPSDLLYFQTPATGPLSIQVTAPTSSSIWYAGESHSITWATTGSTQNLAYCRVYYSLNGGTVFSRILPDQPVGAATMNWQIPSNFSTSQAKIKVVAFNAVGTEIFSAATPNFSIQLPGLKPTARPDVNNSGPAQGTTVTFTGTASTAPPGRTITSYQWNLGDGTNKTGASVTHAYTSGGSYNARLTVTDSAGQTDSRSIAIYVSGKNLGVENESSMFADPVNLATGNFILDAKDLEIPGMGLPLQFSRFYNSKDSSGDGLPIGHHWTHSYHIVLTEAGDGSVAIRFGDGRQETHTPAAGGGYTSEPGVHDTLEKPTATTHVLRTKDQISYNFVAGRLESISDRNNNTQALQYDAQGRLQRVLDPSGRFLDFSYNPQGRIAQMTDPLGRSVQYGYDAAGHLTTVTDPRGGVTAFTYDALHQLLTAGDPNGNTFVTNEYDAQQRVVSYQRDALGNQTDFHYDFVSGLTTVTDPFGNETKHLHDERLRLVAKTDELGHTESYEYDDDNNRTAVVSKNGHATRYTYDSAGNVTSKVDAHGSRTIIEYNSLNDPVFRMDAIGHAARLAGSETDGYGTSFDYDVRGNLIQSTDAKGNATVMTFNPAGKILTLTDRRGNSTTHDYDAAGNRIRTTDAIGGQSTSTFDAVGRVLTTTDQNGHTTHFTYDAGDHVLTIRNPLNHTTTHEYDANGNRVLARDPVGGETRFEYDAKDRLVKVTDAMGGIVRHEYDAYDRKTKTINALGNATLFGYDAAGRMTSTTDPLGNVTSFGYDPNGNRISATDPLGNTSHFSFDELDRLISSSDALGNTTAYEYDRLGRRTKVTDALGRETRSEFDPLGKLVKVTDAAGGIVLYAYDEEGNRISMTNPLGKTTQSTYDALNRLIQRQEPAGSTEQYAYDGVGNRTQRIDAKNQTVGYLYDDANRLIRINYPVGLPVIFTYDAKGNRISMQDTVGTSAYAYDALNRMTSYTNPFDHTVGYEYDANSNRKALIYPGNKRVDYTYDTVNRMLSVKDWGDRTTTYQYDAAGRLTTTINPNGTSAAQTYDDASRLATLSNRGPGNTVISEYAYTLDAVGNHLGVEQHEPIDPTPNLGSFTYDYDDEDRIEQMEGLVQTHDANGNLTGSGAGVQLGYDYENRLVTYQSGTSDWTWRYDGTGKRLEMDWGGAPQHFVLDVNGPLAQVIGVTVDSPDISEYYVYGLGLVSRIDASENATYYHYDSRGSTVSTTDTAGQVVSSFAYDPFGRSLGRVPAEAFERFTFLGRHGVMDDRNGFHFVRARYYSTRRGRFLSKDPFLGLDDQSQTLNRYVYALNNPLRMIDVSGFSARESDYQRYDWRNRLIDIGHSTGDVLSQYIDLSFEELGWQMLEWGLEALPHKVAGVLPATINSNTGSALREISRNATAVTTVISVGTQAYFDHSNENLSGSQKLGRASISVIPGLDFVASLALSPDRWDTVKNDLFTNQNPLVDWYSDHLRENLNQGFEFDQWLSNQTWLDGF